MIGHTVRNDLYVAQWVQGIGCGSSQSEEGPDCLSLAHLLSAKAWESGLTPAGGAPA